MKHALSVGSGLQQRCVGAQSIATCLKSNSSPSAPLQPQISFCLFFKLRNVETHIYRHCVTVMYLIKNGSFEREGKRLLWLIVLTSVELGLRLFFVGCDLFSNQASVEVLWSGCYFSQELICVFRPLLNVSCHYYRDDRSLASDQRLQDKNALILWSNQIGINICAGSSQAFITVLLGFKDLFCQGSSRSILFLSQILKQYITLSLRIFQRGINYKGIKHKPGNYT